MTNTFHFFRPGLRDALLSLDIDKTKGPERIVNAVLCNLTETLDVSLHLFSTTFASKC